MERGEQGNRSRRSQSPPVQEREREDRGDSHGLAHGGVGTGKGVARSRQCRQREEEDEKQGEKKDEYIIPKRKNDKRGAGGGAAAAAYQRR